MADIELNTLIGSTLSTITSVDAATDKVIVRDAAGNAAKAIVVNNLIGAALAAIRTAGHVKQAILLDVGDETTDLATGTAKKTFRMPYSFTLTEVPRASVNTAPAGSTITVDINEGGASILSPKLTIDAGEKTSVTATTAAVLTDSVLADDAEITIDIDQVGSGTAGKGLKIALIGFRT